ncbi:hypothetical protein Barb4_01820 [Bacteroidales bacterium Barb4]|nr:hypothetical protein Barb4_01820 [Bacteroidales bacterium Barb4]
MYSDGVGFRAIGCMLNISYGTVYKWVREYKPALIKKSLLHS